MTKRVAVIFGGTGAIGSAVARKFVSENYRVCVCAREASRLDRFVDELREAGGTAEGIVADVLELDDLVGQMQRFSDRVGEIAIVVNSTGFPHNQGTGIDDLSLAEYFSGITPFLTAQFNIARSVAPLMGRSSPGKIITIVAPAAGMAVPGHLGHTVGCAGMEAFDRALASELGPRNIRVLTLRSHAISDAAEAGSYTRQLFEPKARSMGLTLEEFLAGAAKGTMIDKLPTLSNVAGTIAFMASADSDAMTASVVNLTGGATFA
jgi:NAD(P)-dependent dehydrogenase (short-subunit alcohol dehydrogenase family)